MVRPPWAVKRCSILAAAICGIAVSLEMPGAAWSPLHAQDRAAIERQTSLGESLMARGRLGDAERAFDAAIRGSARDSLTARVRLGEIRWMRGERAAAMREFDHFIDVYNDRRARLTSRELTAVGIACRYLGEDDPELFKDALKAFDEAIARDTTDLEPRILVAELFLDKYNNADAQTAIADVLARAPSEPRALLASARRLANDGEPGAMDALGRALRADPQLADAHVLVARIRLDAEDPAAATEAANRALAVDSAYGPALAVLAAARIVADDSAGFADARRRALARNPHDGEFFATLGEVMARNRFYARAAAFAREGVERDPKSWRAHGVLGQNLLRTGELAEGRRELERAFAGDPYDVQVKNTLDLLDTFGDYSEVSAPHFEFMIEKKDADLLALYLRELAAEAYDSLAARYGYHPPDPVRVELYRSHADFSVRTMGLPGIGALGVSFGTVLAMDSPFGRRVGDFNWGSTFWHELAHAFTLGASDHRVPRWFSEGLSVFEERRARRGWGARVTPDFLAALKGGALPPVSRLNDAFTRPAYPQQISHAYYEASLVCELIARDHGIQALVRMLRAYGSGMSTAQVFQSVLGTTPERFDAGFDEYMRERFGSRLAIVEPLRLGGDRSATGPPARAGEGRFADAMRAGVTALRAGGREDEAARRFEEAKAMFPEYTAGESAYWHLARLALERGDTTAAIAELLPIVDSNETQYDAHLLLAELLERKRDIAGAARVLELAMYISPGTAAAHERLAAMYATLDDWPKAVRERRAVVALAPADRAEALYQLALALHRSGDDAGARRAVLRSLETAPNFERAQKLLLELHQRAPGGAGRVP